MLRTKHQQKTITLEDLKLARYYCAQFINEFEDGEKLLPIFERLEKEIAEDEKRQLLLSKAKKIANDNNQF